MAGDWLKVEHATLDKPEIFQMAEELNMDSELVFAKLVRVWIWFDQHSTDGNAPVTLRALLDRKAGVTDFAKAMQEVGWLEEIEVDGKKMLHLPNFDRHVGQSAKKRALTSRRQSKFKEKKHNSNSKGNADSVIKVTPDASEKALPREEKRREDINTNNRGGSLVDGNAPAQTVKIEGQKRRDYSDFKPEESTLGRIRMDCIGITDDFINGSLNEFITYAEEHYRPDQLQSKFLKSINSDFKRQKLNGHRANHEQKFTIPRDPNKVMAWAQQNDYPPPRPGEDLTPYTSRIKRLIVDRKRDALQ